ncbi:hypothetical protein [Hymenobacter lapidarius]|uniref:hypothetical protein n=1 Tax=Hymenobacter lapidarius TaxID=1908237 RepID=UPI0011130DF4|nr:hypothetical protein [Hymenobacter lapidarius]
MNAHTVVPKFGAWLLLLGLLQFGLLFLLYQPLPTWLDTPAVDIAYNALFAANSMALASLAYRYFRCRRIKLGVLAAIAAFPGLLFWATILASLLANRAAE